MEGLFFACRIFIVQADTRLNLETFEDSWCWETKGIAVYAKGRILNHAGCELVPS